MARSRRLRRQTWVILGVVVALLVAGGAGAWYWLDNRPLQGVREVSTASGSADVRVDRELSIKVPAGSLDGGSLVIERQESSSLPPHPFGSPIGPVYRIETTGAPLAGPIELAFRVDAIEGTVFVASHDGQRWRSVEATVDPSSGLVRATTDHLSSFVVLQLSEADLETFMARLLEEFGGVLLDAAFPPEPKGCFPDSPDHVVVPQPPVLGDVCAELRVGSNQREDPTIRIVHRRAYAGIYEFPPNAQVTSNARESGLLKEATVVTGERFAPNAFILGNGDELEALLDFESGVRSTQQIKTGVSDATMLVDWVEVVSEVAALISGGESAVDAVFLLDCLTAQGGLRSVNDVDRLVRATASCLVHGVPNVGVFATGLQTVGAGIIRLNDDIGRLFDGPAVISVEYVPPLGRLTISPGSGKPGTVFEVKGTGFPAGAVLRRHVLMPDGRQLPTERVQASATGTVEYTIQSRGFTAGQGQTWVMNPSAPGDAQVATFDILFSLPDLGVFVDRWSANGRSGTVVIITTVNRRFFVGLIGPLPCSEGGSGVFAEEGAPGTFTLTDGHRVLTKPDGTRVGRLTQTLGRVTTKAISGSFRNTSGGCDSGEVRWSATYRGSGLSVLRDVAGEHYEYLADTMRCWADPQCDRF